MCCTFKKGKWKCKIIQNALHEEPNNQNHRKINITNSIKGSRSTTKKEGEKKQYEMMAKLLCLVAVITKAEQRWTPGSHRPLGLFDIPFEK